MVGHNDLDARSLQRLHLAPVADAAVHRHEQVGVLAVLRDAPRRNTVAVGEAVGQKRRDVAPQRAQAQRQHRGAAHPVGVVVAVDEDAFLVAQGVLEPLRGLLKRGNLGEFEGRVE